MEGRTFASCACCFRRGIAVCIEHKSEVCGVCCSDYAVFNFLRRRRVSNPRLIRKHHQIYLKNPKRIKQFNPKRVMARDLEQILDTSREQITQMISAKYFALLVTLCGYACFVRRFNTYFDPDAAMYLVSALEMDLGSNKQQLNGSLNNDTQNNLNKQQTNAASNNSKTQSSPTTSEWSNIAIDKFVDAKVCSAAAIKIFQEKLGMAEVTINRSIQRLFFLLFGSLYSANELGSLFDDMNFFVHASPEDLRQMTVSDVSEKLGRIFEKYGSQMCATAVVTTPQNWTDAEMNKFLMCHGLLKEQIDRKRLARDVLEKIAKNIIDMKLAIRIALCSFHQAMESGAGDASTGHGGKPLCKIGSNLNPFMLPDWTATSTHSISFIFGLVQFMGDNVSSKPVEGTQQTFYIIAKSIDEQDVVSKIPMFIVQDEQQRSAIAIVVTCIKKGSDGSPLICIKYFRGKRSSFTMHKAQRLTAELRHGQLMQTISAEYEAMQVLKKLLRKNRHRLVSTVVNEAERQLHKGWKISAFMPYVERQDSDNKCCLCSQSGRHRCSHCKKVVYCSRHCQKKHWKSHKKECRQSES